MENSNLDVFLIESSPEETKEYVEFIERETIIKDSERIYSFDDVEEIFEDVKYQMEVLLNETNYGEPQAWIYLEDNRSIEITIEQEGLPKKDYFYSIRLHCSEDEFNTNRYNSTTGIIESLAIDLDDNELKQCLKFILSKTY